MDDDFLEDDLTPTSTEPARPAWQVLVVDDEEDVHVVTRLALANTTFESRPVNLISARSGAEARAILGAQPDIALILLDVVMETEHAGLDLARWLRQDKHDHLVRIVLRTGQPGVAPERQVIRDYDINDYQAKSQLTQERLFTVLMGSLRNYSDLRALEASRRPSTAIAAGCCGSSTRPQRFSEPNRSNSSAKACCSSLMP